MICFSHRVYLLCFVHSLSGKLDEVYENTNKIMLSYILGNDTTTGEWVFETLTEIPYDSACKFDKNTQIEVSKKIREIEARQNKHKENVTKIPGNESELKSDLDLRFLRQIKPGQKFTRILFPEFS